MIKIQASSIKRLLQCPGSAGLEMGLAEDLRYRPFKDAATFGTKCHDLAEQRLKSFHYKGEKPPALKGIIKKTFDEGERERAFKAVNEYEKYFNKIHRKHVRLKGKTLVLIEEKIRYTGPNFDAVAKADGALVTYQSEKALLTLDFFDLKTGNFDYSGAGAVDQIMFGALLYLSSIDSIEGQPLTDETRVSITAHVVQPNYYDAAKGVYKEKTSGALNIFFERERFRRYFIQPIVKNPDQFNTGEACKFCPAVLICPAMQHAAGMVAALAATDTAPEAIDTPALEKIYLVKNEVETFLKAVESTLLDRAEGGARFSDLIVVLMLGHRRWTDKKEVEKRLSFLGEDLYDKKIKSPAQVEKLAGKENISDLYYTPQIKKLKPYENPFKTGDVEHDN